jgi:glycosyltransferase involved in cell wall biosynthesis
MSKDAPVYEILDRAVFDEEMASILHVVPTPNVKTRVALIGGFTPRRCGIATFTADIHASLIAAAPGIAIDVYAMTPAFDDVAFDAPVRAAITQDDADSYTAAAQMIEASQADVVWLQHEFGLFGGYAGDMILGLVDRIAAPLIVTLHTVLAEPDAEQMRVMSALIGRASKLVVMARHSADLLKCVYNVDDDQIILIEHGVPDRPFGRSAQFKAKFGWTGRDVLMTFGLLSPGKGIEGVILALPSIIEDHPNTLYCIVGATHPNLLAREGEKYREGLKALAVSLGVDTHIEWIDSFVETEELLDLIEAADIYVTPYPGAGQSTSGTLSYAVALGKAVVSTPYVHARELLGDGHGVLVPFNDSAAIASEVGGLLDDPAHLLALQKRAYARGRAMIWPAFAARSLDVIDGTRIKPIAAPAFSPIGLSGLLRICDDTGIIQHSIHNVPDRNHGYCVDDNARALMLMNRLGVEAEPHRSHLATTFAAFIQGAWNPDAQEFRNFMGYRRDWLEEAGSEDSCGRTVWAIGATTKEAHNPALRHWARWIFESTASSALDFGSPRALAFAMLGADYILAEQPEHRVAMQIVETGANRLADLYARVAEPDWHWFETSLAYDNCRLSEAMIRAGMRLGRPDITDCGIESLRWITHAQIAPAGHFRPVGSNSFGQMNELPMPFDQQPVEIWAAIDAASAAYDVTGDAIWFDHAKRAYDWFSGLNDRGVIVGDPVSGTCRDGLNPRGVNLNEGAESVLAYQLSTTAMRDFIAKMA